MKKFSFSIPVLIAGLMAATFSCMKRNEEFRDMQPVREVKMSTYDFLKSANKGGLYDTLIYLLDKTGLADKLKSGKVTFFVPQDFSIAAAMYDINFTREKRGDPGNWTVDSVRLGIWDTLLSRYMLEGTYDLDTLRYADGMNLVTPYGYEMNGKAIITTASGIENGGSMVIQYSDKNESRIMKNWVMTTTEAANLKTTTGVVHMLEPKHIFGFSSFTRMGYPPVRRPYFSQPMGIPGHIELGYYDHGGEGLAYHDNEIAARGTANFRKDEGVDLDNCTEGLYNTGYTNINEWLKFTVKINWTGKYRLYVKVASPNDHGRLRIEVNDVNVSGSLAVPKSGGYQTWRTLTVPGVQLTEGVATIYHFLETGGYNAGRFAFIPEERVPYNMQPASIPGEIFATEFDFGLPGQTYFDSDEGNKSNSKAEYRVFEGPDCEKNASVPGTYSLSHGVKGEWASYTVDVKQEGDYKISFNYSSGGSAGKLHLEMDDVAITGSLSVPASGGYGVYKDFDGPVVHLAAGRHILKFVNDNAGFNLYTIKFIAQ
ncbi:carbohydrate-binding protein [Chitinophaga rhizosphaerae]|uniref:carbohydrate-binding protein n=1 Tax=Chitinophaga rhizosphaerae TaxID=1864947 RepID=UPI000F80A53A|nr:carbohydrate-binding protein [Chitinophaga rhizosphaerae]